MSNPGFQQVFITYLVEWIVISLVLVCWKLMESVDFCWRIFMYHNGLCLSNTLAFCSWHLLPLLSLGQFEDSAVIVFIFSKDYKNFGIQKLSSRPIEANRQVWKGQVDWIRIKVDHFKGLDATRSWSGNRSKNYKICNRTFCWKNKAVNLNGTVWPNG